MAKNENLVLKIITPNGCVVEDTILKVSFKSIDGDMVLMRNFAPTIGTINFGKINVTDTNNKVTPYLVDAGVFYISNNNLEIITTFCVEYTHEAIQKLHEEKEREYQILTNMDRNTYLEFTDELFLIKQIKSLHN